MTISFPQNFIWGVATSAYQVEGATSEDGRGESIWDRFCTKPGAISDGSSGAVACDSYHRYAEDITIAQQLGVKAYRLSIAWPRIVPQRDGKINQAGIDYYRRLLDALREAGIATFVTLYHWDLPQYLEDNGGWSNRETALCYADYVKTMAEALGDRIAVWTTLNEPWCTAYLGYGNGIHAPGIQDYGKALAAVHHLNLAHGLGVQAIRSVIGDTARTNVVLNLATNVIDEDTEENRIAKHRADLIANEVFLGPMFEGCYDSEIFKVTENDSDWSFIADNDLSTIHQPVESLGINYYSSAHVRHAGLSSTRVSTRNPLPAQDIVEILPPTGELTAMGWNQEPQVLTAELLGLSRRFENLKLVVTENGSAWNDVVSADPAMPNGKIIHDTQRVNYLNQHIAAVAEAMDQGANVTGYFAWSLLDNFEWSLGYEKRFGIIGIDYATQERIWKDSALRYREIIAANAV